VRVLRGPGINSWPKAAACSYAVPRWPRPACMLAPPPLRESMPRSVRQPGLPFFGRDGKHHPAGLVQPARANPGDGAYREFPSDLGWESARVRSPTAWGSPESRPLALKPGIGLTGQGCPLGSQQPYEPENWRKPGAEHALRLQISGRLAELRRLEEGGWTVRRCLWPRSMPSFSGTGWYEGPTFLAEVLQPRGRQRGSASPA